MLRFAEDACVQCGLCEATCPEKVITLTPQLDFRAATAQARVLKEEEPFRCIRCGKPFGVKSTIERVTAKLEGKHWMFKGSAQRLDVIKMCEDCRVAAVTERISIPTARRARNARTTEDYLRERERAEAAIRSRRDVVSWSRYRWTFVAFSRNSHQRRAVFRRADGLLRHLGAGRVGGRADLEQFRDRLRRPDDVELLQRIGKVVARQRRDPAAEDAGKRRAGAVAFVRASACGRRRRRGTPRAPRSPA